MALPIEQPQPWPQQYSRRHTACKAWRVDADNLKAVAEWVGGGAHTWAASVVVPVWWRGKRGEMSADIGDWVVQLSDGRFTVADADTFHAEWFQAVTL